MKKIKFFYILVIICFFYVTIQGDTTKKETPKKSQCVICHTSAKSLIKITREIAKGKPVVKHENKGEG
jgi:hypothetical protein